MNQLKVNNISKTFGSGDEEKKALNNVSFTIDEGECVVIGGENGSGKSVMMNIIAGLEEPDSGSIESFSKIGLVFQEAETQILGETPSEDIAFGPKNLGWKKQQVHDAVEKALKLTGLDGKADYPARFLSGGEKRRLAVACMLAMDLPVIIFDEPSAALTEAEIEELFKIIRDLREQNLGIVYISHRMDEIKVITDRVTVMRDGTYVGTLITNECTKDDIINMMVGRVIYEDPKSASMVPADAPVVLKVEHLNAGRMVQDVSFELHKGEILGFSGLMGAGRTETARAIFGADPKESGDIYVNGEKVTINTPQDAVKCGIGYLSEDRKRYGIVVQKTVAENSTMACLQNYMKGLFINKKTEKKIAEEYVESLATKTPSVDQLVVNLSGGNQQKVVIAKWLINDCDILIFDEPTRGIDVGAKNEIYKLMNKLASEGKSIIMISSEMTEILRMSDRIVVMCEGRKTGEVRIEEATQEVIMNMATREIG